MTNLFSFTLKNIILSGKPFNISSQFRYLPRWHNRKPVNVIAAEDYDAVNDGIKIKSEDILYTTPDSSPNKSKVYGKEKDILKENLEDATSKSIQNKNKISWKAKGIPKKEFEDTLESSPTKKKITWKPPSKSKSSNIENTVPYKVDPKIKPLTISNKNPKTMDMLETTIDEDGNFIYTKMANNDVRITEIFLEVKSKKEKEKKDLIILEGKRLIKDALDAGCKLEYILFSRMKDLDYLRPSFPKIGAKLYKMPYREMQLWSDLVTNPGIMGVFKIPDVETYEPSPESLPITVICDNIREAGNLGAVLRTSSGVGCEEVILTKGCVNIWDSKVLRAATGAHFKLKLYKKLEWEEIQKHIFPYSQIYIADNNILNTSDSKEPQNVIEVVNSVPLLPYYGVNYASAGHIVLIIGGETEGISEESYKLAAEFKGARLNIPLVNNVDSLNTGTALGIIAFEIRRQLMKNKVGLENKSAI